MHQRVLDDRRDLPMHFPTSVAEVSIQHGRQQRMGEADRPIAALDHVRFDSRTKHVRNNPRPLAEATRRSCRSPLRGRAPDALRLEARRSSRAAAHRASQGPETARADQHSHPEREPAPARRTDSRQTARESEAASGARTASRAGRAGAGAQHRRSAAPQRVAGRAPNLAPRQAKTAASRRGAAARAAQQRRLRRVVA